MVNIQEVITAGRLLLAPGVAPLGLKNYCLSLRASCRRPCQQKSAGDIFSRALRSTNEQLIDEILANELTGEHGLSAPVSRRLAVCRAIVDPRTSFLCVSSAPSRSLDLALDASY